jgi:hypothetical protein
MRHHISLSVATACMLQLSCGAIDAPINLGVAKSCDAAEKVCYVSNGRYSISLELEKKLIPLKPFTTTLKITAEDDKPHDVVMDFRMVGMDMGLNRYRLNKNGNVWTGSVTLPVCVASRTDWLAVVEFTNAERKYIASFPFQSGAK